MHNTQIKTLVKTALPLFAGLISVVGATPLAALSADEIIAKHIAARGGDRWESVDSMKLTGTFTAFSEPAPFTIHRKRADKYRIDSEMNHRPIRMAFDGDVAWQINPMYQADLAQKISGLERHLLMQDVDFATPFFEYREKGYGVKRLDNDEIDGQEVLCLELARAEDFVETWYLDPETYLEVARDSPASDFGRPDRQRTYFDDFRTVDGLVIPHYLETQWYTRNRVFEIASIEANVPIDDAMFRRPPPPGMEKLLPLIGEFKVKAEQRQSPDMPWTASEYETAIESRLSRVQLREESVTPDGFEVVTTLSYDRFRERYVMTLINDFTGHLDVREGNFDDDGRLTLSNIETGTSWSGFGMKFSGRTLISDIREDGFTMELETSLDGGENWFVSVKLAYARKE